MIERFLPLVVAIGVLAQLASLGLQIHQTAVLQIDGAGLQTTTLER